MMPSLFLMTVCKKDTDIDPDGAVTAVAGQSVQAGQVVTLDDQGKPLSYQ